MKLSLKIFLVLVLSASFMACDIPGILIIENHGTQEITYRETRVYPNDSINIREYRIPMENDSNQLLIIKGFWDLWGEKGIERYIDNLESIEFDCPGGHKVIQGKAELKEFFKNNRKGIFKRFKVKYKSTCPNMR